MHEAKLHDCNSFVTLTYRNEEIPPFGSLRYVDVQLFLKRLRKVHASKGKLRYFVVGEYGELELRPHYHALLFGIQFTDLKVFQRRPGYTVYSSAAAEKLWGLGFVTVGEVNFETAGYAARYCLKKVTGTRAKDHYKVVDAVTGELGERVPEFARMSLKPGIGAGFVEKYVCDLYPHGRVVVNGRESRTPRYYDQRFTASDPDSAEQLKMERELAAYARRFDNTTERLRVKEEVAAARLRFKARKLV